MYLVKVITSESLYLRISCFFSKRTDIWVIGLRLQQNELCEYVNSTAFYVEICVHLMSVAGQLGMLACSHASTRDTICVFQDTSTDSTTAAMGDESGGRKKDYDASVAGCTGVA